MRTFQLHTVAVTNPDIIHRHSCPVAAGESLKLAVFTAGNASFLFHHFRQFFHGIPDNIIGRHHLQHVRFVRIATLPFRDKILVGFRHRSAVSLTILRQKFRQPANFFRFYFVAFSWCQ
ncbi:Uncharacterised protein [Shigella flexneri]|nr:Uncharacterised protein [Shigella flexneri]